MPSWTPQPPPTTARRIGYLTAVVLAAVALLAINLWPGWQEMDFLSHDFADVLLVINASLAVAIAAYLVYVVSDPPRLRAAGGLLTGAVALAAAIALWRVFPFTLGSPWAGFMRVAVMVGLVGTILDMLVRVATLLRPTGASPRQTG